MEHSYLNYPGGLAVFGSKAELTKEVTDENAYDLNFDLEISYINNTDTDLVWALYMVEGSELEGNLDPKCELVVDTETDSAEGKTRYWYTDDKEGKETTSCTLEDDQKAQLSSTTMLAYGKFTKGKSSTTTINKDTVASKGSKEESVTPSTCTSELCDPAGGTANNLKGRTLSLGSGKTSQSTSKYYYLVVQYPNEDKEQAQGSGSQDTPDIQVTLKVTEGSARVAAKNSVTGQG